MQPREQVTGGPLLEGRQGAVTLVGTLGSEALANPLQVPGRPQATRPLRGLSLGPGECLAERIEPVHRDLGGPLGQRGKPATDPLDRRPLEVLVAGQERRDLVDPLHAREGLQSRLAFEELLAGVGDRQGVPDALVTFLQQLLLDLDALQPVGLEVEQVVVVFEFVQPAGERERAGDRRQGDEPRMPHQGLEPGVHRHRLGNPPPQETAVHDRQRRRQHEQFRGTAQQDPAAGDHAQLGNPDEAREGRREEGHGRRDGARQDARPDGTAGLQQGRLAVEAAAPGLQVAAQIVGAVVDADADHRDREGDAQDVQVADAGRGPAEGPRHPDHEHTVGHDRVPHAAEAGDHHQDHRRQRQAAGPDHRLLAAAHLVVFHHRQAGEADRGRRMPRADPLDDPPQLVGGGRGAGEAPFLLDQPQEHEAQPAVLGQQVLARQVAQRADRLGHRRPGGDVVGRAARHGLRRLEPGEQALAVAFDGRQRRLAEALRLAAGHHLRGQSGHHRADAQLHPAAVEHRLRPLDELVDRRQILRREVVEPLGADPREVDLVEHRAKQGPFAGHFPREFLEHRDHVPA